MLFKGMEKAMQGMIASRAKQDIIANNLANVGTAGFQKSTLLVSSFADVLQGEMSYSEAPQVGGYVPAGGIHGSDNHLFFRSITQFSQGSLKNTGYPFDLALDGEGFFAIQTKNGLRFTRNGSFNLDANGNLVTKDGSLVLGEKGPIKVSGKEFIVNEEGIVLVDNKEIDRLKIVNFETKQNLYKEGENYFFPNGPISLAKTNKTRIKQGFLEMANVNAIKEMVDMMTIMRAFEANQKLLHAEDQMLAKTVNEIGKLK